MRHYRITKAFCFLSFGMVLLMFNCAPKAVKTTTKEEYEENLSEVRPPIDTVVEEQPVENQKVAYVKPANDITRGLNSLLDSIAVDNKDKKVNYYTIQVYVGNNRDEANEARSKVYRVIPDETPKLEYSQPNYRVKIGMFMDRIDAHKTLTQLKNAFPGAILLTEKGTLNK